MSDWVSSSIPVQTTEGKNGHRVSVKPVGDRWIWHCLDCVEKVGFYATDSAAIHDARVHRIETERLDSIRAGEKASRDAKIEELDERWAAEQDKRMTEQLSAGTRERLEKG